MQAVVIALLCLINLILWLVFFLKFKQLFSTDDIIQKTRDEYELLLSDVNRNALQNINLIDMKIEELKSLIEIADRRLATVQNEVQFQQTKFNATNQKQIAQKKITKKSVVQSGELDFNGNQTSQMPKIYMSKNPIKPKQSFEAQVRQLYEAGYTVDRIAHELKKSTTEVELLVEML